ncbi:MAG: tetratricopeptide repeat protein [candidate division Zixibacteria bacterium]|nr:tetratricopeptide repeat protein [candidate division Zixibacteria bacterium]
MMEAALFFVVAILVAAGVSIFWYRRSLEQQDKPDQYIYIEGLKALLRGQDEQAFTKLKDTVLVDTNNIDAYIQLGNIFRRRKKHDQALKVHKDLTHRGGLAAEEKREILIALYKDYLALDDEKTAVKAVKEILAINSGDKFALDVSLHWLEKQEEWKEAAKLRRQLDKTERTESIKTLALYKTFEGQQLFDQGDPHRARLFFKEAIHIDKNCLAAYVAIGDSYFKEKRLDDALRYWTKVIALKPAEGQAVFERLKKGFFEVGRYGDYAEALSTLLQGCPEHLTARLELAYFMEKKGDKDSAREHYVMAQDNHPDSLMVKLGLFRLNRESSRREAADNMFKQIMKMVVKKEATNFRCRECDLISERKVWLCPRCKAVDSYNIVKS